VSDRPDDRLTDEEELARRVLLEAPPPRSGASFRDRLRDEFISGAIEVSGTREARGRARRKLTPIRGMVRRRRRASVWIAASLAAAAAVTIVIGTLNQGQKWMVTGVRGDGSVAVDGETVPLSDRAALNRLIVPGAEVKIPEGVEIDLVSGGVMALQLTRRTDLTIPPPPTRWINRRMEMHVRYGDIRMTTGPDFHGTRLNVFTPEASVEVVGTTLAVIVQTNGTCVCVLEGAARVGRMTPNGPTDIQPVRGGRLRFVWKENRPPSSDHMRDMERIRLAQFRDAQRPWLEGTPASD
jgi:hypothetical protein